MSITKLINNITEHLKRKRTKKAHEEFEDMVNATRMLHYLDHTIKYCLVENLIYRCLEQYDMKRETSEMSIESNVACWKCNSRQDNVCMLYKLFKVCQ